MTDTKAGIRLKRVLAEAGVCSRRAGETRTLSWRCTAIAQHYSDRRTPSLPTDRIRVDDRALPTRCDPIHLLVHKPAGVVTTTHDPEGRPTVVQLVPDRLSRLFPVGRLDV